MSDPTHPANTAVRKTAAVESPPAAIGGQQASVLFCPETKQARDRLRAMASDLVASWKSSGLPAAVRSAAGLRSQAERLVGRLGGGAELVGWTMVTIVSEFWRDRLAAGVPGRRLLLLPDCPAAVAAGAVAESSLPAVCGPGCGITTIWSAARDCGWVVESTSCAVSGIGSLLTGQYDGILGVAGLEDLEKAFAMLPAFSLPVAAVPHGPATAGQAARQNCAAALADATIDVEWVLGLLGVAGGASAPVGDYLPLLRESAEMFSPERLDTLAKGLGMAGCLAGGSAPIAADVPPLDATAAMAAEFLARGGKFLRPFICLAAYDAVRADLAGQATAGERAADRDAVKAAAVAIEVFHKASLVHDDIEDDDRMRYGRETLHVERGVPAAINVGDYLLGIGYRLVSSLPGAGPATLADIVKILADAHVRLARGQGAELWWRDARDKRLSPAEALAIYGLKTSPAFEAAVAMGIRLAGLNPADVCGIDRYSLHVGTGFQVLNDLKDWSGDVENRRTAAGDLLGGRPTLMWAVAVERLPSRDVERLQQLAADAAARLDGGSDLAAVVAEVRDLYRRADVFARAAAVVEEQRALATAALSGCRYRRLREVLELLLDLAVPEQAAAGFVRGG